MKAPAARTTVTAMFAVTGLLCGIFTGRFPALVDRFALSPTRLSVVLFVWALCATLATVVIRPAVTRFGSAAVLRSAAPAGAVALVAVAAAPTVPTMLAALAVFGAAFGILEIAVNSEGAALEQVLARPLLGGMHAAWGVGAITGGALAAAFGHLGTGYAWSVGPVALCAVPVTLMLNRGLNGPTAAGPGPAGPFARDAAPDPHDAPALRRDAAPGAGGVATVPRQVGRHRRSDPAVRLLSVAAFAALVVEASVADWCGVLLRHDLGMSHAVAGLGYPLFQCGLLGGRLVTDRIRAAYGPRRVLIGSGLATALSVALAGSVHHPAVVLVALFVVGVTIGPALPTLFSAAAASDRSAIARIGTAGYTGLLAGPVMVAGLTSAGTLRGGLGTVVVVFGVTIAAVAASVDGVRRPLRGSTAVVGGSTVGV